MSIQLTPQQQQAIDAQGQTPARLIDPRSNAAYVLVPEAEYDNVHDLLEEERRRRAIHQVAIRNAIGRMDEGP